MECRDIGRKERAGRARKYVLPDRAVGPPGPDILEIFGLAKGAGAGGVVFF